MKRLWNRLRAFWTNADQRRTAAWLFGVLAVLSLLYGLVTLLEAHNRYTELSATIERLGPPKPDDPGNTAFALMLRDRDRAENRRWQGVMFAGLGLVGLGLAYLFAPGPRADATPPQSGDPPRAPDA